MRQFSLLMFNLRYIFTVFLLNRDIADIREGKQKNKQTKKSKTLWELSFRHAFYLVQVVRVADVRVAWLVYLACLHSHVLRAYCNFESKQAI